MNNRKYFPLGKAYGEAFCNRVQETTWLVDNLLAIKHSLLIAPRRYGKSSLVERAIVQAKLPHVTANFHLCTTEQEVSDLITDSVAKAIGNILGPLEKMISSIKKYVTNLSPQLSIGSDTMRLQLSPKNQVNRSIVIFESLLLLDKLLHEKNKYAVLFFDEFQEIARIPHASNIEGAIRTAAQEMQNVTIIFSGSIRSLLLSMFDEENKPLYKLCRKLKLIRISVADYEKHLNKAAQRTWKKPFSEEAFMEIMNVTHRHPYYVNYLCDTLWQINKKLPTKANVISAWQQVVEEEWSDTLKEISLLSLAQRKVLKYIANQKAKNLTSHENSQALMVPPSTVTSALESLIERDYIEKDADGSYEIINPLLLIALREKH